MTMRSSEGRPGTRRSIPGRSTRWTICRPSPSSRTWHDRGGKLLVRGVTSDNGVVKRVVVNGQEARKLSANFAEWEVVLDGGNRGAEADGARGG